MESQKALTNPKETILTMLGNADFRTALFSELRKEGMISKLGNGEVFFLSEKGQTKRGFKVKVDLQYPTQFCFPAGPNQKAMITAEGYDKINQYAGIEVFRPRTVVAQDGSEKGNPYFERDPQTGAMLSVFMRGIGIGYSPVGNLAAVDQTVYVNLQTLLVQEIQAKIKRFPALGCLGSIDSKPSEITYYGDNGKYGKQRVVDPSPTTVQADGCWHFVPLTASVGYWVNISHPEIQAAFDSFTQKQRFLERTTFSILKRLVLSSHPAIASKTPIVTQLSPGEKYNEIASAKAHTFVYGFAVDSQNPEEKRQEIEAMAERVAESERMANMEIIQGGTHDGVEDAEIADPISAGADPSEIPPETFAVDDSPDYYDRLQDEMDGIRPTKAGSNTEKNTTDIKDLEAMLSSPALQAHCLKVRRDMGVSFSELRKSESGLIGEFMSRVQAEVDKK